MDDFREVKVVGLVGTSGPKKPSFNKAKKAKISRFSLRPQHGAHVPLVSANQLCGYRDLSSGGSLFCLQL